MSPKLQSETIRAQVLKVIETHPGIQKSALARELDAAWSTVTWHLDMLARERQIRVERVAYNSTCLFPRSVPNDRIQWLAAMSLGSSDILDALRESPGSRISDLSQQLGQDRKSIRRHLNRLQEEGLVLRHDSYQARYYLAAEQMVEDDGIPRRPMPSRSAHQPGDDPVDPGPTASTAHRGPDAPQ